MLTSAYGQLLLLKLALVIGLLSISARHKFYVVPQLVDGGLLRLRHSIGLQIALAALILLVTAALTTLTGPAG